VEALGAGAVVPAEIVGSMLDSNGSSACPGDAERRPRAGADLAVEMRNATSLVRDAPGLGEVVIHRSAHAPGEAWSLMPDRAVSA
jgi:hypothetical protein